MQPGPTELSLQECEVDFSTHKRTFSVLYKVLWAGQCTKLLWCRISLTTSLAHLPQCVELLVLLELLVHINIC